MGTEFFFRGLGRAECPKSKFQHNASRQWQLVRGQAGPCEHISAETGCLRQKHSKGEGRVTRLRMDGRGVRGACTSGPTSELRRIKDTHVSTLAVHISSTRKMLMKHDHKWDESRAHTDGNVARA